MQELNSACLKIIWQALSTLRWRNRYR